MKLVLCNPRFANVISRMRIVDSVVIDETGLNGYYRFQMKWQPEGNLTTIDADRIGPGFVTALEEQLGLSLTRKTVRFEQMVVDHIERPSPDARLGRPRKY
jgi:uncharacterized protein (TIGR03435 family)